ncbi:MAG: porin family protein [Hyphomicrobiales bacterium]|nr:porin family protein [Hyphomicrobiales bacterium]
MGALVRREPDPKAGVAPAPHFSTKFELRGKLTKLNASDVRFRQRFTLEVILKSLLLGVSALALATSLASAADLPARNVPIRQTPVVLPLFVGFYAGLNVGSSWNRDRFSEQSTCVPTCAVTASSHGGGVTGGAMAGFAWRMSDYVLGVEADLNASSLSSKTTVPLSEPDTAKTRLLADGSVRLRAGYVFGPVLAYVTGGLAYGRIRHTYDVYTSTAPFTLTGSADSTRWQTGWTLGGGLEYAFAPLWTARVEYRYTRFGRSSDTLGPPVYASTFTQSHRESFNTIRFGVTRYF